MRIKKLILKKRANGRFRLQIVPALIIVFIAVFGIKYLVNNSKRNFRPEIEENYLHSILPVDKNAPNIVLIYADDLGLGDLSCYGSKAISTPNIDAMAKEGVMLISYYAPSSICSPSRAGLLTGRYPVRSHVPNVFLKSDDFKFKLMNQVAKITGKYSYGMESIAHDEIMLQEALRAGGYQTALIGKWHLGEDKNNRPNNHGFDYFYGALYSNDITPYHIYENNKIAIEAPANQEVLTKDLTNKSIEFIKENKGKPFFLYYASPFPHDPAHASKDWQGTSKAGVYGDCVQELDWSVGEVFKALKDCGIDDNTLVIFTSDNGPWFEGSSGGSRGRKATLYNGGYRVPFIARYPGVIPSNIVLDKSISGLDIYPTVLELSGLNLPSKRIIDGMNILPYLTNEDSTFTRGNFVLFDGKKPLALVSEQYKYIRETNSEIGKYWFVKQGPFLYDLKNDADESYDVSMQFLGIVSRMRKQLEKFDSDIKENLRGDI